MASFDAGHIRPTTDRVKESIFNKLQGYFENAQVLDLFSGTGNLAIEALSRGALHVDSVEMNKKSIGIIQKNIELLQISKDEIRVISSDVLKYLKQYQGSAYDVILADPPFTQKMADDVLRSLCQSLAVGDDTLIMIESSTHEKLDSLYEFEEQKPLERFDSRDYGDKVVSYFKRKDTL